MKKQRDNIQKLIEYKQTGNKKLRNQIIMDNEELVWYCVNRYTSGIATREDMFQAGVIGLINAIERFDYSLGYQLSTFAFPYIQNEIRLLIDNPEYIEDHDSLEIIDEHADNPLREKLEDLYSKLLTEEERMILDIVLRTNDEPAWSINDISRETGLSSSSIRSIYASGVEKMNQPWVRWYIKLIKQSI